MTQAPPVGFLGLGAMGGRMVARLLAAGYAVAAYDPEEAPLAAAVALGAERAGSAAEVADRAEIVLLSLPTPEVVRGVAGGLMGGAAIRTVVDLSTSGPAVAREVAELLGAAGIAFVDAPVSGGVTGAQAGRLTVMAAADADTLARVRPLLDELAGRVLHVGSTPGMGQLAKVINNLLSATALIATAEAMALGVRNGLDAELLLDVLNASSGRNSATAQKLPQAVLPRTFDFGFALALMNKDVQICLEQARAIGLELPVGEAVASAWRDAQAASAAGADCTEIVKLVERATGASIRASDGGAAGV
jgi:3-hydroxyisobutyrate dehydrogenase-like beta-hydroxyacid dehydrogenase